jgi:hypothetical protein
MKSLMLFLRCVLTDVGTLCGTSTDFDLKTIEARVKHEGISFLTISLPAFAKDFERGLELGQVDRHLFQGFTWKGGLPRLFGGFLDQVFDRVTGRLLDLPSTDAIFSVRQVSMLFGKIGLMCSDERRDRAMDMYFECEQYVREGDLARSDDQLADFHRVSGLLFADVFSEVDKLVYDGDILPRHSSGATADRIRGNAKYEQQLWTTRLEVYFPHGEYLAPSWSYFHELQDVDILEPGSELPVRVISVPKTLKTPRIIAIEPTCVQYVQQGLLEAITKAVRADDSVRQLISWESQVPNQHMAFLGSLQGELATLDLSEASDRVSNQLVTLMLSNHPHLAFAVDSARSAKADLPGYGVIPLAKFASMGSALCFPFESMVFMTVIFLGVEQMLNRRLRKEDITSFLSQVRTYGDDIIVPVSLVQYVIRSLEAYGLVVNKGKSFWAGRFRESCGKDYYAGVDVSVVRCRSLFPSSRTDVQEVVSTVALRNQLYLAGLWKSVRYLDKMLERIIPFPAVESTSSLLGKISFLGFTAEKWDSDLQRPLVKGVVLKHTLPNSHLDGYGALLKYFLKRGEDPFVDVEHLERSGRPVSVYIKTRLACPF